MDEFGDVVYNLYGSTEVAWVAIAGPKDLLDAPGTAGRPPRGTELEILGDDDRPGPRRARPAASSSRNSMLFEGYTGGGSKDMVDGMMATGDVGRLDEEGRLFVEGRDDDMIVSGGENVFPQEVEETLAKHPKVAEAAVIGVDDEKWGQALKAFVVKKGSVERVRRSRSTSRTTWPATRSRSRSSSSTSCRATPPARCSSASSRTTTTMTPEQVQAWLDAVRGRVAQLRRGRHPARCSPTTPATPTTRTTSRWSARPRSRGPGSSDQDEPGTWEAAYAPSLIAGDTAIAKGETRYADGNVFSNLFELVFDADGRCVRFVRVVRAPSAADGAG